MMCPCLRWIYTFIWPPFSTVMVMAKAMATPLEPSRTDLADLTSFLSLENRPRDLHSSDPVRQDQSSGLSARTDLTDFLSEDRASPTSHPRRPLFYPSSIQLFIRYPTRFLRISISKWVSPTSFPTLAFLVCSIMASQPSSGQVAPHRI